MRVGKKPNIVEAKKTRSCVVRLEKVDTSPPPPSKVTRAAAAAASVGSSGTRMRSTPAQNDEQKKNKGPIKKRPLTDVATPRGRPPKAAPKETSDAESAGDGTPTPTIAAGRSRRAIKPNPKYANVDLVTPKLMKTPSSSAKQKSRMGGDHESSSDDFFNHASSDEMGDDDDLDDLVDKAFKDTDESDLSDVEMPKEIRVVRKRGRPPKSKGATPNTTESNRSNITSTSTPNTTTATSSGTKQSAPSQLQQLRKKLANHLLAESSAAKQRRLNEDGDNINIIRKRYVVSAQQYKQLARKDINEPKTPTGNTSVMMRNILSSQKLNGSKVEASKFLSGNATTPATSASAATTTTTNSTTTQSERTYAIGGGRVTKLTPARPLVTQRTLAAANAQNKNAAAAAQAVQIQKRQLLAEQKQRSTSPALRNAMGKYAQIEKDAAVVVAAKNADDSFASVADDIESMPTFTIVNINDIINKKGDVLISKTGSKVINTSSKSVKSENSQENSSPTLVAETRVGRRKTLHATIVTENITTESTSSTKKTLTSTTRTSFPTKGKPAQTILNHQLLTKALSQKQQRNNKATVNEKPAPRILNSMVAKKTQPVKPMITNLDDSADESMPMSLGEEDTDSQDSQEHDGHDNSFTGDGRAPAATASTVASSVTSSAVKQKSLAVRKTPTTLRKTPTPTATTVAKENSLAATNRPSITKHAPEKVVISREGGKVIKKITCFETWFVINLTEQRPNQAVRNVNEIPLIKLANAVKDIELPSERWTTKVTLHEVPPSHYTKMSRSITMYTGSLEGQNIAEDERHKYQPSCVMFRRKADDIKTAVKTRLPFDRAVIFKNNTFYTNIDGKNVKLMGAPQEIHTSDEVEILLNVIDMLSWQSCLVEPASNML